MKWRARRQKDLPRFLGEDHPDALVSRNNLAFAYQAAGDLGRAIPLHEQVLADSLRLLGEDAPETLVFRNNLAYACEAAGDLGRAIPLYEQVLADSLRVLGEDAPETLTFRGNLAFACQAAGDLGRAIPLYEQTLAGRQRVLGKYHPQTRASRSNLAAAYEAAADLGRAIRLDEPTLADSLRTLGGGHSTTETERGNPSAASETKAASNSAGQQRGDGHLFSRRRRQAETQRTLISVNLVPPVLPSRSVAAGRDISGIVATGDYAMSAQYQVEQMTVPPAEAFRPWAELSAPAGLGNLPARPGRFVGRAEELARLDAALAGPGGVVVQAVRDLGGIGKSTLAGHWASARAGDYSLTWWITADTPGRIDVGLADLAVALQPALSGVLPLEALREGAVQWLAAHQGWLLILDNVTDPADVAPLLARTPTGRYLITSRRATGWDGTAVTVRLDVLDPAEAVDMLTGILTHDRPRDADGAGELCEELGYLPLAIEQAGAYLTETGVTPRTYLGLLARYPADRHQATAEGGDPARAIARIWHVTLDRLAGDPLAGQLLRILAWYAPDSIPRALLDGLADPPALLRATGRLAAYSMLTADSKVLAVHRLVQAVTRIPDLTDPHRGPEAVEEARDQATRQLVLAIPDPQDPAGWAAWRVLVPHIDALASHTLPDTDTEITAHLLNEAGTFRHGQGQVTSAAEHFQRALADSLRILGEDHPRTLICRSNLAAAYLAARDIGRAIPLYEQTFADSLRVLGEDHTDTLACRNDLAGAYELAGDLGRAIPLYEQVLADQQRVLGQDHPRTLISRNNLAGAYAAAGDLGQAIPLQEQVLADRQRVLGQDHPSTLISRNNLASAYASAGDLGQAIPLREQVLADRQRVLGQDHPHTLASRSFLASAYAAAGDLGRAIPLQEQVLADQQRILGKDHPDAQISRSYLADAYKMSGDLDRAIPLYEQVLANRQRVLGHDHPDTLTSRSNLAAAYAAAGKMGRAHPPLDESD